MVALEEREWFGVKRRALVLGGGGTVGIAWEIGLLVGLLENGVDLGQTDLVIGTSAGSVVGTFVASGYDLRQVLALQQATAGASQGSARQFLLDPEGYQQISNRWWGAPEVTPELRRELGQAALGARTIGEPEWLAGITQLVGDSGDWPAKALRITGVDAGSGEPIIWDNECGIPLHLAVASSCTVPGIFPPVTIGDRRYIDGGVRSGTNADLATGYDSVVIIGPLASEHHPLGHRQMIAEVRGLQTGGAAVAAVVPDQGTLDGFGISMMDPTKVGPAALNGLRQGRELAQQVAAVWQ